MKVNIKGLVFTGFAAAILSANAMAAGENIVTSKSFTEATYHKKANADFQVSKSDGSWQALATEVTDNGANAVTAAGIATYVQSEINTALDSGLESGDYVNATWSATDETTTVDLNPSKMTTTYTNAADFADTAVADNLVTQGVINSAIAAAANVDNFVVDNLDSNATNKAPSQNAVNSALSGKQNKTTADSKFVVGNSGGTWEVLSSAVLDGDYTTQAVDPSTGAVTIDVDATTNSALTDSAKIPTAGTVKAYVDAADSALDARVDALESTDAQADWTETNTAAVSFIKNKPQDIVNILNGVKVAGSPLTVDTDKTVNLGAAAGAGLATGVADSDTGLVSGDQVYDYVQSVTGGTTIPKKATSMCTDSIPCALVYESTGAHWRTMATDSHNGGVLADYCDANNTSVCPSGASCNTTNNVCVESANNG